MKAEERRGLTLMTATRASNMEDRQEPDPEMVLYRNRTTALLRRYCRLSMELGRVPSLLGRDFFRSKVTSYRMHNFEDVVIFVHDVERCLEKLDDFSWQLIARITLQEYSATEAAKLLNCSARTVERRHPEALDLMSSILLEMELLEEIGADRRRNDHAGRDTAGTGGFRRQAGTCDDRESGGSKLPPKKPVVRVEACQEAECAVLVVSSSIARK